LTGSTGWTRLRETGGVGVPREFDFVGYFALFWVIIIGFWVVFSHKVMVFSRF